MLKSTCLIDITLIPFYCNSRHVYVSLTTFQFIVVNQYSFILTVGLVWWPCLHSCHVLKIRFSMAIQNLLFELY